MSSIKNIIFDFGNVLIDLNMPKLEQEYLQLFGASDSERTKVMLVDSGLLPNYETGKITEEEFLKGFKAITNKPEVTTEQIKAVWNAMLGDIPKERIEMIQRLKKDYGIYMLSNINQTHADWIHHYLEHTFGLTEEAWRAHFDIMYYSHEIGHRKPEDSIYEYLLSDSQLNPAECIFIDDLKENTLAAQKFGIQTYTHVPTDNIVEVVARLLGEK